MRLVLAILLLLLVPAHAQIGPPPGGQPPGAGEIITPIVNIVNRSTSTSSTALISVPAGGTPVYRINYYLYFSSNPIPPPANFSDTVSFAWTDASGTSSSFTSAAIQTLGTLSTNGVVIVRPNPGSDINYSVSHGFTSGANYFYTLTIIVEKLN